MNKKMSCQGDGGVEKLEQEATEKTERNRLVLCFLCCLLFHFFQTAKGKKFGLPTSQNAMAAAKILGNWAGRCTQYMPANKNGQHSRAPRLCACGDQTLGRKS